MAFERTFSILFGLIPAIFLLVVTVAGAVLVLLDGNLSTAQKTEGCAIFLLYQRPDELIRFAIPFLADL